MRHAILGAGGLEVSSQPRSRAGSDVVILAGPESVAEHDGSLVVDSAVLGQLTVDVPAT